jgi:hypothetical protein
MRTTVPAMGHTNRIDGIARAFVGAVLLAGVLAVPTLAGAQSERDESPPDDPSELAVAAAPTNDDFAEALTLSGTAGIVQGDTGDATLEADEPWPDPDDYEIGASVWFEWTAPEDGEVWFDTLASDPDFDTVLAVWTGAALDDLDLVSENDQAPNVDQSELSFEADQGSTYLVQLSGYFGDHGGYELRWETDDQPPANDAIASPSTLRGRSHDYEGDVEDGTGDATAEVDEPAHADGFTGGHSVWYRWTAPVDGDVEFDVFTGSSDVALAAYAPAATVGALDDPLASDWDFEDVGIDFTAVHGSTYLLVVDAPSDAPSSFELDWQMGAEAPANDDFAAAEPLTGSGEVSGVTYGADEELDEPDHGIDDQPPASVWFTWTPPEAGMVTIATEGSDFDTVLAVHTGSVLTDLQLVAGNDDAGSSDQSRITFEPEAPGPLHVALLGRGGEMGTYELQHGMATPRFTDVGTSHPFFLDIEWLVDEAITTGYQDGTFKPAAPVTRQAMSAFLYRLAGEPSHPPTVPQVFSDVPPSHPFFFEIDFMEDNGIAGGYQDGTFRPGATVTRQAMSAFMHNFVLEWWGDDDGFIPPSTATFTDVSPSHPFYEDVEWMAHAGISTGYPPGPTYRPASAVTRQAMAAFLHRLDQL